ncbi:MAG: substrate-binding periplasmic protein [Aestuariibacter sp.]
MSLRLNLAGLCKATLQGISLVGLLFCFTSAAQQNSPQMPLAIVYAGDYSENNYTLELLNKALFTAGERYISQPLGYYPPRGRDFNMMEKKEGIDIMWGSARRDRESRFLAIRIPIFKGLIGWRIPLVMNEQKDMFKTVDTLSELTKLRPGQYFRWTDTAILRENGIDVFAVNTRETLMDMLVSGKFDYYPRAVIEIEYEYQQNKARGVVIDDHILMIYPTAFYYYVHKENKALARNLNKGLEQMIVNGEMDRLFDKHFGAILNQMAIHRRHIFRLQNSNIPDTAPLSRSELWLDPASLVGNNQSQTALKENKSK